MEYIALTQMTLGNYPKALQITLQGVNMAEKDKLPYENGMLFEILGRIYLQYKDYSKALGLFKQSQNSFESVNEIPLSLFVQNWIGGTYILTDQLDSATYYCKSAYTKAIPFNAPWLNTVILTQLQVDGEKKNESAWSYTGSCIGNGQVRNNFSWTGSGPSAFCIGDYDWISAFHDCNDGVGSAEVDADDFFCHDFIFGFG